MLDGSGKFSGVAAKEMEEETGLVITEESVRVPAPHSAQCSPPHPPPYTPHARPSCALAVRIVPVQLVDMTELAYGGSEGVTPRGGTK